MREKKKSTSGIILSFNRKNKSDEILKVWFDDEFMFVQVVQAMLLAIH